MSKTNILAVLFVALLSTVAQAETFTAITPGPSVSTNVVPFGGTDDIRYQQIYDSQLFLTQLSTGPIKIDSLGFSVAETGIYNAGVEIRFSQTPVAVGALSTDLDANAGTSFVLGFSDPVFSQAVAGGDLTYQLRFDTSASSFVYDPTSGENLLIDFVVTNKGGGFSAFRGDGQGVTSRATSTATLDSGLRTLINFSSATAIPEPSSYALLAIATGCIYARRCRKAKRMVAVT